jgi:hypothetical protein
MMHRGIKEESNSSAFYSEEGGNKDPNESSFSSKNEETPTPVPKGSRMNNNTFSGTCNL